MSGGSYRYLCYRTYDLSSRIDEIEEMAKRLESSGYSAPASATWGVLRMLAGAKDAADGLAGVWRAVEWADSGDYGEDQVREAVAEFSPARTAPKGEK